MPFLDLRGVVRMDTDTGPNPVIGLGNGDAASHVVGACAVTDRQNSMNSRLARPLDHRLPVIRITRIVQVSVRVNEHYFKRAPLGMSSWKPARIGRSSTPREAATIMP